MKASKLISLVRNELQSRLHHLRKRETTKLLVAERKRGRIAAYESVLKMLPKGKPGRVGK